MSDEEIFRLIDEAAALGIRNIVFSGGEPLLRKSTAAFLEHAADRGLKTTLLTNGLLIDSDMASFLVNLDVHIKISLDGTSAAIHDRFRGAGTFEKTLNVLRMIAELESANLTVHYTVNRLNLQELPELPGLLKNLGVPNMVVGTIKPSGRAAINQELLIPPAMIPYVNQLVTRVVDSGSISLVQFTDRGWGEFGCPAVCSKLGITARGYMTTCAFFGSDMLGGNIRDLSLSELWTKSNSGESCFEINETCQACKNLERCAGGCRARAAYYYNDKNAPDPYSCALYKKKDFVTKNELLFQNLFL